ncbi:MAG TPA: hypothetical protein VJR47_09325 [Stellaceae bacterium]|nr:hypothetical protein [Stellaceae bacterium]
MMAIGRWIGWLFLMLAGAVLVRDLLAWHDLHRFALLSLAGFWRDLDPAGFRAAEGGINRLAPWLWSWLIGPAVALWALPVFGAAGLVLIRACRRQQRRRRRRR